jgi:hypothetical protein
MMLASMSPPTIIPEPGVPDGAIGTRAEGRQDSMRDHGKTGH